MTRGTPPHRRGEPSPLVHHLAAALTAYLYALLAAPRADAPQFPWHPRLREAAARIGPDLDQLEVAREVAARLAATRRGLEAWQRHPYRRSLAEPPSVWGAGATRLLDYGQVPEARDPDGPPVLAVPSLINKAYILDLAPERSLMRWLAAEGFRPFLLDWGTPGRAEQSFDLDAYGRARLLPALAHVRARTGAPVALLGYCMGGTIAAGLAARAPDGLAALAVIGAPWNFDCTAGIAGSLRAAVRSAGAAEADRLIDGISAAFGFVPVLLFQVLFALLNPIGTATKFQRLASLDRRGQDARMFVALEDWLADGMPMAGPAARNLLVDWQIRNTTATGAWRFLGGPVAPETIGLPTLAFAGRRDAIAPPALAEALPRAVAGASLLRPRTGHVGMVVGGRAATEVWRPLAEFLRAHSGRGRPQASGAG